MIYTKSITSEDDYVKIRNFVADRVGGGILIDDDSIESKLNIKKSALFIGTDFVELPDLTNGFGQDSSMIREWLVTEILHFLKLNDKSLILVEDFVGSPVDPILSSQSTPIMWIYQDRILWPILPEGADPEYCKAVLSWAAGGPQIIYFCAPISLEKSNLISRRLTISDELLKMLKANIKKINIDVFDSEGYLSVPS